MKTGTNHPEWALKYRKPGTELKLISGRYYLYGVKSVYDQTIKRSRKISLGILGSISEEDGFTASEKSELKKRNRNIYLDKQLTVFEYGFAKWLIAELENSGLMNDLKAYFPAQWKFIVLFGEQYQ